MKFSLETIADKNFIESYGSDHVVVKNELESMSLRIDSNVILSASKIIQHWQSSTYEPLFELSPELIIYSGSQSHLSPNKLVSLSKRFAEKAIGIEMMSLGAACRTFNLLLSEGRNVVLAINFD